MKKSLLVLGLTVAAGCSMVSAQTKINGAGRMMIHQYTTAPHARSAEAPIVSVLVALNPGYTASDIEAVPCEVTTDFDDILMVSIAIDQIENLAALDAVKSVDFGTMNRPMLDRARALTNVDPIHSGNGDGLSGTAYTGKGVTVGLYDTGLDPNHVAFRNADGKSRVKAIYVQRYNEKDSYAVTDPTDIDLFTTEATDDTHGTHVLGIIAGSKGQKGRYAAAGVSGAQEGDIPYYGSAYESDILISCGDFIDGPILKGIENVVNKGVEIGQPIVVNLSLGNNSGSHDPNSTTSRFLDRLGEKAIICISAGNEGESNMAVKKTFSPLGAGKSLKTFIMPEYSPSNNISYTAEFWGDCDEVLNVDLIIYDRTSGKAVETISLKNMDGSTKSLTTSDSDALAAQFAAGSYVYYSTGIDSSTNRYNLWLQGNLTPKGNPTYMFGVNISGTNGHTVYGYVNTLRNSRDNAVFSAEGISGYSNGTPNGSINGFGCGKNMISVGAFVSRSSCPYVGGGSYPGGGTEGDIAAFSSYGETGDGRRLPDVCGPGAQVVSAISTYYARNLDSFSADRTNAVSTSFGRNSYYYPMQGTSMSSPFVAGVMALWLEAFPEMTVAQAKEIIAKTSTKDRYVNSSAGDNPLRWGAGKIDALAGLKEAIKLNASLNDVMADSPDKNLIIENLGNRTFSVCFVGARNISVDVFSMTGAKVATTSAKGDTAMLDASSLPSGVYVVNVTTPTGNVSKKYVVK